MNSLSERILSFEDNGGRFKNLDTDHCIYVFVDRNGNEMILSHDVDDIICGSKLNNQELSSMRTDLPFKHVAQRTREEVARVRYVSKNGAMLIS